VSLVTLAQQPAPARRPVPGPRRPVRVWRRPAQGRRRGPVQPGRGGPQLYL